MSYLSYKKLWHLLIDREMTKGQLRESAELSASTMVRLQAGQNVTTDALVRICTYLGCQIGDICEITNEEAAK